MGFQFLGEANFSDMYTGGLSPQAQQTLNSLANGVIELEQYIDFFCNRTLRRTLLCKQGIPLDRKLTSDRARGIFYAAEIRPQSPQPDLASPSLESFASTTGHAVNTSEPIVKAALVQLGKIWPKSIVFEELLDTCGRQLTELGRPADTSGRDATILGDGLLHGAAGGMIDLRANWPTLTTEISATPAISPLARAQLAAASVIANRRHEAVNLNEFERFVLVRTDGTQSIEDLVRYIVAGVKDGTLRMSIEGQAANPAADLETTVRPAVMAALTGAARGALLVS